MNAAKTPAEIARLRAIREEFQRDKPSLAQLQATGEYDPPVPLGELLELRRLVALLKAERERQGLSLADLSKRTGIDTASLSRLESGRHTNPTLGTLTRYAQALGKRVLCSLEDLAGTA